MEEQNEHETVQVETPESPTLPVIDEGKEDACEQAAIFGVPAHAFIGIVIGTIAFVISLVALTIALSVQSNQANCSYPTNWHTPYPVAKTQPAQTKH
jgi:hypothetical protein